MFLYDYPLKERKKGTLTQYIASKIMKNKKSIQQNEGKFNYISGPERRSPLYHHPRL